ncbi:hypothetical protein Tco_1399270 [Tanacetum coccineum]
MSTHRLPTTYPVLSTHLHLPSPITGLCGGLLPGGGPEEYHADYPADGGDDDDEPSDDDDDDDDTDDEYEEPFKDEDDDEEEQLTPADSSAIPVVDPIPSSRDTKAFETDEAAPTPVPSPRRHTARMSVRPQTPIPLPSEAEIPSLPLPPPPSSLHLPPNVHTSLPLPSSLLPPLPASLFIPPLVDRREDILEAELPPHKRLCSTAPTSRHEVRESLTAASRPTGDLTEAVEEVAPMTLEGVNTRVTELVIVQEKDTQVSSLHGQLSAALGHIQALQARDQTHVDDHEGASTSTTVGLVFSFLVSDNHARGAICMYEIGDEKRDQGGEGVVDVGGDGGLNNMPPRISAATARTAAAARAIAATATPMTAAAVEQLIEARVSATLANHETLLNSTNGQGDRSHNSNTRIRGTNSYMKTVTQDVTYAMEWKALKKMMTVKYCPRGKIKKLEIELWNLKVKGTDVTSYTLHF